MISKRFNIRCTLNQRTSSADQLEKLIVDPRISDSEGGPLHTLSEWDISSVSSILSSTKIHPDPPSRRHLLCCLRSLLLAAYCLYASVGAPWRLAANTSLMSRDSPKSHCYHWKSIRWIWVHQNSFLQTFAEHPFLGIFHDKHQCRVQEVTRSKKVPTAE